MVQDLAERMAALEIPVLGARAIYDALLRIDPARLAGGAERRATAQEVMHQLSGLQSDECALWSELKSASDQAGDARRPPAILTLRAENALEQALQWEEEALAAYREMISRTDISDPAYGRLHSLINLAGEQVAILSGIGRSGAEESAS